MRNELHNQLKISEARLEEINALLEKYELSLGMNVDSIKNQIEQAKNKVTIKKKD